MGHYQVLSYLPLHKALPVHMSAVLQSVNSLRFYRTSGVFLLQILFLFLSATALYAYPYAICHDALQCLSEKGNGKKDAGMQRYYIGKHRDWLK